jgi:hypothetical protein
MKISEFPVNNKEKSDPARMVVNLEESILFDF